MPAASPQTLLDLLDRRLAVLRTSRPEAADALGLAQRTAGRYWSYARAWLYEALREDDGPAKEGA